jgi:hypothetical protein
LGNSNHAEAFLKPAPALFFYSNILDTVGSKMTLYIDMQQSLGSVNQPGGGYEYIVDGHGGTRTGQKSSVGERVGGLGAEFGTFFLLLAVPLQQQLDCCCLGHCELLRSASNHQGKWCIEDM